VKFFVEATDSYRPDIDGLRAIAVLSVLFYHAFPDTFPSGFIGVDIFFVISGYLITGIILKELKQNRFKIKNFYARRIKRIFPALVTVLVATIGLGWLLLLPTEFIALGKHLLGAASFTSNLILWSESGYFDVGAEQKPLLHLWSLGVEEQFYILWPLILITVSKITVGVRYLPAATTASSLIACVILTYIDSTSAFFSPLTRFWELGLGALLAQYQASSQFNHALKIPKPANTLISALGFGLVASGFLLIGHSTPFPGGWALLPTLGAVMIILSGNTNPLSRWILTNRISVFFGLISYPLYLWHWPFLSIAQIIENGLHRDGRIAIVIISILLAYLTYRFIEKPIRGCKTSPTTIKRLLAGMVLCGAFGALIINQEGFESRIDSKLAELSRDFKGTATLPRPTGDWCNDRKASFCSYTGDKPTFAIIGDSHARSLSYGLKEYIAAKGETLLTIGTGGCHLFLPSLYPDENQNYGVCEDELFDTVQGVGDDSNIHTVFITSYTTGKNSEQAVERQITGLERVIDRLKQSGKKVIYLMDVPVLNIEPRFCLPSSKQTDQEGILACRLAKKVFTKQSSNIHAAIADLLDKKTVPYIELAKPLCDDEYCYGRDETRLLYVDDNHLSIRGALFVIEGIKRELDQLVK
jgi:peptidoglycan/LPS O-acetylase OafA/YrhL